MTTRIIRTPEQIDALAAELRAGKLPVTITTIPGAKRSDPQNRIQHRWMDEIARQVADGTSAEHWRAYCKLTFGVPIRRRDDEAYDAIYVGAIAGLPYEDRLACMAQPFDLPVTRDMTKGQKAEYLDAVQRHFLSAGFVLTDPAAKKYEAEFGA